LISLLLEALRGCELRAAAVRGCSNHFDSYVGIVCSN
jgi:hypothetical protein